MSPGTTLHGSGSPALEVGQGRDDDDDDDSWLRLVVFQNLQSPGPGGDLQDVLAKAAAEAVLGREPTTDGCCVRRNP